MWNNSWFDTFPGIFSLPLQYVFEERLKQLTHANECDLEFKCQRPKFKILPYFKHRSQSGGNLVMFGNQNLKGVKMYEFEVSHIRDDKYQKSISDLCWRHIVCSVSRVRPLTWTKYTLTLRYKHQQCFPKFTTSMIPTFQPSFTVFTFVLKVS